MRVAETVAQPVKVDNDLYVRDYSRCILCYKCVEACGEDAQNTFAIAVAGRGFDARISTEFDVPLPESACVYCGNCIGVCPTGALMFRSEYDLREAGDWAPESRPRPTRSARTAGSAARFAARPGQPDREGDLADGEVGHERPPVREGPVRVRVRPGTSQGIAAGVSLLLAGIAVLALVEFVVNLVFGPQVGPLALGAAFEPHVLAIGRCRRRARDAPDALGSQPAGVTNPDARASRDRRRARPRRRRVVVAGRRPRPVVETAGDDAGERDELEPRGRVQDAGQDAGRRNPRLRRPRRPDVVALQELTPAVAEALEGSAEIDRRIPYRVLEPRDDVRGWAS